MAVYMKAVVVYESLWGNTAKVAKAIAEGIGPEARALTTDEATADAIAGAELIVAGSPLLGFSLPTEKMREDIGKNEGGGANPPDIAHPSMRAWLDGLPKGAGKAASFETRIWWSPGSAARAILKGLENAGYSFCRRSPEIPRQGQIRPAERRRGRTRAPVGR